MNTRILTRISLSVSLMYALTACSDSTQFAEQTLPGSGLDASKPGVESPEGGTAELPDGDLINEDSPTGETLENPDEESNSANGPGAGAGSNTSTAGGSSSGGSSASGGSSGGSIGSGNDVFTACSNVPDRAIVAQLYRLPENTERLPDFSAMNSLGDVCVSQLNIADREFTQGFPGVSDIFEWFALDMRFKLNITRAGNYQFFLNSDDGSKLTIDDTLVIDNDGTHSVTEKSGSKYLAVGVHDVRVRYFQGPRVRIALELFWKVPGSSNKVYVPASAMSRP